MSEPTPKPNEPNRPAASKPAEAGGAGQGKPEADAARKSPVAKRLPSSANEAALPKSSAVIAKSRRVLDIAPPPVIAPKKPDADDEAHDTLPEELSPPADPNPKASFELDALQLRAPAPWVFFRRRVRLPPRWERWLTDPQRRRSVGVASSVALHAVAIVLLIFVLRGPGHAPAPEPIPARIVEPATAESAALPEPVVRQEIAGSLETVGLVALATESGEGVSTARQTHAGETPASLASAPTAGRDASSPGKPATSTGAAPGLTDGSRSSPDLLEAVDAPMRDKLSRRTADGRSEGVRYEGGSTQSEEALERALRWLVIHQRDDGSWHFNHLTDACQHYCSHPGSEGSTTAATGMALLPFLGAGYTHKKGDYQDAVARGLEYLKKRGMKINYGNDLRDGSMYGQALATIALCEAYGMTRDADLREAAQGGIDFIGYAQDNNTGGWRYNLGEPGDTTVTGWMLMALKSGQMAGLNVPSPAIFGAERFLDSVQNADGSEYGYQTRKPRNTTTAVALLCRMYTGWRRDNPGLIKGIAHINTWGPSQDELYYDYYATQVLFHWHGPEWDKWNAKMRERLIATQDREAHSSGSWYFESPQSAAGGRLYNTAMAAMILEVYYRFMPLYGEEAIK